jgi:hypothetical protein
MNSFEKKFPTSEVRFLPLWRLDDFFGLAVSAYCQGWIFRDPELAFLTGVSDFI